MAAEDEQGDSASPNPRDDNSLLTDSNTTVAAPTRPSTAAAAAATTTASSNSNNNSTATTSTNNNSSPAVASASSATASVSDTSSSSSGAGSNTAGGANNSDSFIAAAVEAQQQQQGAPASSTAVSDSTLLVDSSQKMNELTASSVAAVSSKLEQVRGYIRQTSTAMHGLEQQADLAKIGQYNTLVKVLRELKTSEVKLAAHLATLLASSGTGGAASPAAGSTATDGSDVDARGVPNSQSIGLVSTRTVNAVDNTGAGPNAPSATPSFSDRLAAGMEEANQITGRLRENVARREDLVERYRATRERLSALKRQRRDIQQQERTILLANSPRESPYEDPIPGAASWSLDELNTGLDDFRALYDKVATLRTAYTSKAQALEEGDTAGRAEIDSKMQQLETKRAQLIGVITQLKRLRADKLREQGMDADIEPDDFEATFAPSTPAGADGSSSSSAATDAVSSAHTGQSATVNDTAAGNSTTTAAGAAAGGGPVATAPKPELQQQLSAAVDAMEATEASVTDPVSRGGSISIGTLPTLVAAADISGGADAADGSVEGGMTEDPIAAVVVARAEMEAAGRELSLRTQHLNNLREELAGMKRLLDVTQRRATANEEEEGGEAQAAGPSEPAAEGERAGEFITGVNGNMIRLSDLERQDPAVIEKYKQLSAAKQRMAQMEQIMQAISSSRGSGLPLTEVLSPEQLVLLEEAEAEEDPSGAARLRRSRSARRSGDRDSDEGSIDRDFFNDAQQPPATSQPPPQPSVSSLPRPAAATNNLPVSGDRNNSSKLISSSAAARRQNQLATEELSTAIKNKRSNYYAAGGASNNEDSDEVSVTQQRLNKPSNAARPPVNEGAGRRKQQLGKQERWGGEDINNQQRLMRPNNSQRVDDASSARSRSSSCNERSALAAGSRGAGVAGDPRVAAIATLQEELRQKKNALEALMRGMGKPSSLHPDNISDNISDGESGTLTPTPTRPTRARRGNRDHSVDFSSSLTEDYRSRARQQVSGAPQHLADGAAAGGMPLHHHQRLHTPSGAVMSFNNLSAGGEGEDGSSSRSVRPKQNSRSSVSRLPESDGSRRNHLGDATNTQQTISEALQQLSTVQGSINSLYNTLRTDRDTRSNTPSVAPAASNNRQQVALQQQQQQQELKYQQQLQQQQVLNNMFALTAPSQPPSLLPGGVAPDAATAAGAPAVPLVSGLQQCFSQLYLHSLEIQALNKHIQVRHQQQMLQLQHLHQQQQLQQVQQQQQQQLLGTASSGLLLHQQSLVPSVYYNAPSLPLMSLPSPPFTGGVATLPAVSGAGVIPTSVGSAFGLPSAAAASAMGLGVSGVAPTNLATYPTFPNFPPF